MMRITGGKAKGIRLEVHQQGVRPATDSMREALFASLGNAVRNSCCLDLFAGCGSYGLEALSRGAQTITFVEQNSMHIRKLRDNAEKVQNAIRQHPERKDTDEEGVTDFLAKDALRWQPNEPIYTLIFFDPPYDCATRAIEHLAQKLTDWLNPGQPGHVCLELPASLPSPELPGLVFKKQFGKSKGHHPSMRLYEHPV